MASTYLRKRALLQVALITLLARDSFRGGYSAGETPTATFRNGRGGKRLWQCPCCQRVEEILLKAPVCRGTPESRHSRTAAKPVPRSKIGSLLPSDDQYLFREAGR